MCMQILDLLMQEALASVFGQDSISQNALCLSILCSISCLIGVSYDGALIVQIRLLLWV